MAIIFNTPQSSVCRLTWGTQESQNVIREQKPLRNHLFLLQNLLPGTSYWYRVNDATVVPFRTPTPNGILKFAVGSDAHFGSGDSRNDLTKSMLEYISNPPNNFNMFFSLGDLVELGFKDNQWRQAFQSLSSTTSTIPSVLVPGNHDTLFSVSNYEKYCFAQSIQKSSNQLWHRIDVGQVHFLVIDVEWSAETITLQQKSWLEIQLASIPSADWTVVVGHGFYYSSGYVSEGWKWYDNPETIQALTPLFEKYGVDMVFSGHNHQDEILQKNGVTYIICGSFGGELNPVRTYVSPASLWYSVAEHSFVDVSTVGDKAEITFRGASGDVLESFTVKNH